MKVKEYIQRKWRTNPEWVITAGVSVALITIGFAFKSIIFLALGVIAGIISVYCYDKK